MAKDSTPAREPSPFEKMQALAQQVVNVPKAVVEQRDKEWKAKKAAKDAGKRTA